MNKIHYLPDHLIAKIAAGEVIERPAYAVKELIENAIDAGATEIKIDIEQAGLKKIAVIDNGCGMSREDLEVAWKTHTTSKVHSDDSLVGIQSFGFRGEALASIAAISHITIKSKPPQELAGTILSVSAGNLTDIASIGMPPGTHILVEDIFSPVPARKKFLRTKQTEYRHIAEIVINMALAFPDIRFTFYHNNKLIFDVSEKQTHIERIKQLLGQSTYEQLLPVDFSEGYYLLTGFISRPQLTTQSSSKYFTFVNKRKVTDRLLAQAVKEAYGTLLDATSYPVFVLFLHLPFEMVDINVHPRKEQVSFLESQRIFDFVQKAINHTLVANNLTFHNLSWKDAVHSARRSGNTLSFAGQLIKDEVVAHDPLSIARYNTSTPLSQFLNTYILIQTQQGILFIDQHAAHERVLFEQLRATFKKQREKKQQCALPQSIPLELSPADAITFEAHKHVFQQLGFSIENFHENIYVITRIPFLFKDRNITELIREILDDLLLERVPKDIDTQSQKMLAFLACRNAVMAGDHLNKDEMKQLLNDLEKTANNSTCPHGRPTRIEMTRKEIARMFKRE